jgi:hypothetical protein
LPRDTYFVAFAYRSVLRERIAECSSGLLR